MPKLAVGGLTPLTSTDFPGCLSAVVFCQGCPWRCSYCHNPHLIPPGDENPLEWLAVTDFLQRRQGLLDGVVFSGGEPTLQDGLEKAMRETRQLGFKVGLHTGGAYPARLKELLPLLDWVGLDIKTLPANYARITGVPSSGDKALESLGLLLESGIPHEVRTTIHPLLHTPETLLELATKLAGLGVKNYALQTFRPQGCADDTLSSYPAGGLPMEELRQRIAPLFDHFNLRPA